MRIATAIVCASLAAMSASAQDVTRESIDLPAQDLETALQALAKSRTLQIIFRSDLVRNIRTAPVRGELTSQEVLMKLLVGTGLTHRYLDENTVTILQEGYQEISSRDTSSQLATSQDSHGSSARETVEEIVVLGKGYGVQVGAKSVAPLREVPNTVTVIDQQRIQEQNLFTLEDLALQTTGLNTTGGDSDLAQFVSRGFAIDNFLVDGVPNTGFTGEIPDLFLYDRVEILRGPAGLFSGSGSPAGSINFVRKRPLPEFSLASRLSAGSWDNYRGEIDLSAPVSDRVAVRTGVAYQDRDQFFDFVGQTRLLAFASADVELTPTTRLTVGAHYDDYDGKLFSGLPGAAGGGMVNFPRSTYTSARWNESGFDTTAGFAELRQELGDRWVLRASGQYGKSSTQLAGAYIFAPAGVSPSDGSVVVFASGLTREQQYLTADVNAIGKVSLFGRDHEVIIGVDYQDRTNDEGFSGRTTVGVFDIYDVSSIHDIEPIPLPILFLNQLNIKQQGLYGQVRLKVAEPLTLVLGGRVSRYESENIPVRPAPGPAATSEENGRFTPYAGIVWDFAHDWSFYVSYADTFQPQELRRANGEALPPVVGEQFEAGVKASLANDRLLLSAAMYRIEQANRAVPDLLPGTYLSSGTVQNSGFEIEANGEILPGWSINAGYAYIDVEDDASSGAVVIVPIPEHNVKLWTRYEPAGGPLQRFSIGGGINWQSETEAFMTFLGGTTGARQPSYSVLDLRLGYKLSDTVSLALSAANVLDEKYYSRISGTEYGNFYGAPTSVMLTINASLGAARD